MPSPKRTNRTVLTLQMSARYRNERLKQRQNGGARRTPTSLKVSEDGRAQPRFAQRTPGKPAPLRRLRGSAAPPLHSAVTFGKPWPPPRPPPASGCGPAGPAPRGHRTRLPSLRRQPSPAPRRRQPEPFCPPFAFNRPLKDNAAGRGRKGGGGGKAGPSPAGSLPPQPRGAAGAARTAPNRSAQPRSAARRRQRAAERSQRGPRCAVTAARAPALPARCAAPPALRLSPPGAPGPRRGSPRPSPGAGTPRVGAERSAAGGAGPAASRSHRGTPAGPPAPPPGPARRRRSLSPPGRPLSPLPPLPLPAPPPGPGSRPPAARPRGSSSRRAAGAGREGAREASPAGPGPRRGGGNGGPGPRPPAVPALPLPPLYPGFTCRGGAARGPGASGSRRRRRTPSRCGRPRVRRAGRSRDLPREALRKPAAAAAPSATGREGGREGRRGGWGGRRPFRHPATGLSAPADRAAGPAPYPSAQRAARIPPLRRGAEGSSARAVRGAGSPSGCMAGRKGGAGGEVSLWPGCALRPRPPGERRAPEEKRGGKSPGMECAGEGSGDNDGVSPCAGPPRGSAAPRARSANRVGSGAVLKRKAAFEGRCREPRNFYPRG